MSPRTWSGLKVNHEKTELLLLGNLACTGQETAVNNIKIKQSVNIILGVHFTHDIRAKQKLNINELISSTQLKLRIWRWRDLIIGRIQIVKTLIIPIFLYRTSLISLDKEFVKEANKLTFNFIWKGKEKVKRSTLISDIEDGGLKAPHLNSIIETQRILCRCKKLANDQPSGWKTILLHYLNPVGGKLVLCCDFDLKKLPIKLPAFYEECFTFFAKCSAVNNLNIQDINGNYCQKLSYGTTKFICIGDNSVYFRNLAEKGILRVGDLISNKNELIIKSELRVLHLPPLDAFRLVSLIDALSTQWRESLKTCISIGDTPFNLRDEIKLRLGGQIVLLEKAFSKIVYKELRNRIVSPPTAKLSDAHFVNDSLN